MLEATQPLSLVLGAIVVDVKALAVHLVVLKLPLIVAAISKPIHTLAMHDFLAPTTNVAPAVEPNKLPLAAENVSLKVALVDRPIAISVDSVPLLQSLPKQSFVVGSIRPYLLSMTFLVIILKLTKIPGSVRMYILSLARFLITFKLSSVNVPLGMAIGALSLHLAKVPLAFVDSSIGPVLNSITMLHRNLFILL